MSIYKINSNLPTSEKIRLLNDMIIELSGKTDKGTFDKNELDALYDDVSSGYTRKYKRNQAIGNTVATYTGWTHLKDETGYSIWYYAPTDYAYSSVNQLYMNNKSLTNKGQALSESATTFGSIFVYGGESGSDFTDITTEVSTEGGDTANLISETDDYLYIGLSTTFAGIKLELSTRGSGYDLTFQYWNGSSWDTLDTSNDLSDNTNDWLSSDGQVSWTIPGDWTSNSVNSTSLYWIRISTSDEAVTTAVADYIIPANNVPGLIALSNTQILNEDWAFCSYGSNIYVTIPNNGNVSYEGIKYIKSSSTSTQKENFFVYNNPYTADYLNSNY